METTTEKYIEVKEALRVADDLVESLSKENEELRRVVEGPKAERASVYQDIMTAVDKKIEEWKVRTLPAILHYRKVLLLPGAAEKQG